MLGHEATAKQQWSRLSEALVQEAEDVVPKKERIREQE